MATVQEFPQVHVNEGNIQTIAASTNFSTIQDCNGTSVCGFVFDEFVEGRDVTFKVSNDLTRGIWPLTDILSNPITVVAPVIPANTRAAVSIDPQIFAGWRYIQVFINLEAVQASQVEFALRPV